MKHTEKEAIEIVKKFNIKHQISDVIDYKTQFQKEFDVKGEEAWFVTGKFELFGDKREFYYVISDQTGEVEYTLSEHGTRNPHIIKTGEG